jgi:DNA-binding response OmpR family regulator
MKVKGRLLFYRMPASLAHGIITVLDARNFDFTYINDAQDVYSISGIFLPDVFIIGGCNPEMEEITKQLLIRLRSNPVHAHAKFICMSSEDSLGNRVRYLEYGADDLVNEASHPEDLASHIIAYLYRAKNHEKVMKFPKHEIELKPARLSVKIGDREVCLVKKEFELFSLLCAEPNRVFKRKELIEILWQQTNLKDDRTLSVHILKIRRKLGLVNIKTINRVGYKFEI